MLHLKQFPQHQPQSDKIKRWLGADGHREFMDYLITQDAVLTAEGANLMANPGRTQSDVEDATVKFEEAAFYRKVIDRLNAMRDPEFSFIRCEVAPLTTAITPTT